MNASKDWENTALVIIDVQLGLFTRKLPIYKERELLENINALENRARTANIPIIYIQHENERLKKGSDEWQLHPELQPSNADIFIQKRRTSAFTDTELKKELDSRNIKKLVMTGTLTNQCVGTNCQVAKKLGYEVILVKDAHSCLGEEKNAKKMIDSWNRKLANSKVELKLTNEITFQ